MGEALQCSFVSEKSIIDFFPSPQMRLAFIERLEENDTYLHSYPDQNHYNPYFNYDFGCGQVRPAYLVQMRALLAAWRSYLLSKNLLQETVFQEADLQLKDGSVDYSGITAEKIIFCDGTASSKSSWFELLPFAPNKGQALIIESTGLPDEHIFKKGLMLAPLPAKGFFWVGSNYEWSFENAEPTTTFLESTTQLLKNWLKADFKVLHHRAGVRPATLERRPFVGFHPSYPAVGILNGMGTKGASLSPFFANQMVQHLVHGLPISPEADVHRFNRLLTRS
jgi:glycine/D-amino acid oxidase-like deaminating enzyme